MNFEITKTDILQAGSDSFVFFLTKENEVEKCEQLLRDAPVCELAKKLIETRKYEAGSGNILAVDMLQNDKLQTYLLVGLGESDKVTYRELLYASGSAVRRCTVAKAVSCSVRLPEISGIDITQTAKALAMGFRLGSYEFKQHKTENNKNSKLAEVSIHIPSEADQEKASDGVKIANIVSDAVCLARDLTNQPSNVMTPTLLANTALKISSEHSLECEIWDREQIATEKFGLLSAVSRGSKERPKFIRITYRHPEAENTIALVGKGITFDTGGYNLKPGGSMESMKDDMSGAADVLGAMDALGKLKPKVNIHFLIPATENCIGGSAIHPGDIFRSFSGKTVEIVNTDAEGRLVLADAVAYARELKADVIVDLATLTGACVVALGTHISGLMSNDDALADSLLQAATKSGEKLHRLPLDRDYMVELKSSAADIKNCGGRQAGTIVGGLFIGEFVGDTKWAHIDLSSATLDADTAISRKGCSGAVVATIVQFVMDYEPAT